MSRSKRPALLVSPPDPAFSDVNETLADQLSPASGRSYESSGLLRDSFHCRVFMQTGGADGSVGWRLPPRPEVEDSLNALTVTPAMPFVHTVSQGSSLSNARRSAIEISIMKLQQASATTDMHMAGTESELEAKVPMDFILLAFRDASFEELYRLRCTVHLQHTSPAAYTLILCYSLYSLYGSLASGHSMLVLKWGSGANAAYNLCWLVVAFCTVVLLVVPAVFRSCKTWACHTRWRLRWGFVGGECFAALFFSLIVWLRCLLGNRVRVAELLGSHPEEVFGTANSGDAELLLHMALLLIYLGMYTHMRFKMLLFPGVSSALAYPISTFATTTGRENWEQQIISSIALSMVVSFVFLGQRQIEVTRRRNLLQAVEFQAQSCMLRKQKEAARRQAQEIAEYKQKQRTLWMAVNKAKVRRFGDSEQQGPGDRHAQRHRSSDQDKSATILITHSRSKTDSELVFSPNEIREELPTARGASPLEATRFKISPLPAAYTALEQSEALPTCKEEGFATPNANLDAALPEGVMTDWAAVDRAVLRMRDPTYSLKEFHEDMVTAFPELALYTFRPEVGAEDGEGSEELMSSGRSRLEELSRTFGALYAVYWLMRLDLDGKQGFCFGYDDSFAIRPVPESPCLEDLLQKKYGDMTALEKQLNFYNIFPWEECHGLITSAGLFQADCNSQDPNRLKAMLVLTAIHDVMKNSALCPTVQRHHAPFSNYKEGQVIHDHDVALDYVLTFYGHVFPSYSGLDEESQKLVRFTQGKMGFNNGWLVQGEAPPGALFHTFKKLICDGQANSADVAFYFVHWVTDLAGAEPTPLNGSEKFVQKFPPPLLASFFRSFPYVWKLGAMTETQVFQEYLCARWTGDSDLGPLPTGEDSIALMRLVLHAQGSREHLHRAFDALCPRDQEILRDEMSRSGLPGQHYEGMSPRKGAPALLVYYGPAFLQRNSDSLFMVLSMLAEVYRQGRVLFPLVGAAPGAGEVLLPGTGGEPLPDAAPELGAPPIHTVTIRIEQLKDFAAKDITRQTWNLEDFEAFFLVRKGDLEAVVERKPLSEINGMVDQALSFAYLNLSPRRGNAGHSHTITVDGLAGGAAGSAPEKACSFKKDAASVHRPRLPSSPCPRGAGAARGPGPSPGLEPASPGRGGPGHAGR